MAVENIAILSCIPGHNGVCGNNGDEIVTARQHSVGRGGRRGDVKGLGGAQPKLPKIKSGNRS